MPKPRDHLQPGELAAYTDVAGVTAYLKVSDRTVRRMLADGLPHIKFGPGQQSGVRIAWSDLADWLDAHTIEH